MRTTDTRATLYGVLAGFALAGAVTGLAACSTTVQDVAPDVPSESANIKSKDQRFADAVDNVLPNYARGNPTVIESSRQMALATCQALDEGANWVDIEIMIAVNVEPDFVETITEATRIGVGIYCPEHY